MRITNKIMQNNQMYNINQNKIKEYYADKIAKEGEIVITTTSHFLHCSV